MLIEEFLPLLSGVRKSGDHYMAICPAHPDKSASLNIKSGEKWVLTKCYAGCSTDEICEALGIRITDLAFNKPHYVAGKFMDDDLDAASLFVRLSGCRNVIEHARLTAAAAKRLRNRE